MLDINTFQNYQHIRKLCVNLSKSRSNYTDMHFTISLPGIENHILTGCSKKS